jgi:transcription antitermination factor NusA-like protein
MTYRIDPVGMCGYERIVFMDVRELGNENIDVINLQVTFNYIYTRALSPAKIFN